MNVGAVYNVLKAQVIRDIDLLQGKSNLVKSILSAPHNPDEILNNHKTYFSKKVKKSQDEDRHIESLKLVK